MSLYLTLKWLHIISSVLLVGTGLGSAFYMFFTNRSGNVQAQAVVTKLVVRADWWFTTPTVLIQPATGLAMAYLAGWPLSMHGQSQAVDRAFAPAIFRPASRPSALGRRSCGPLWRNW